MPRSEGARLTAGTALFFVVLFGFLSMFSDMTYEGARSITGPYLRILGASAAAVGIVAGLGELIGNAVRLATGFLADRTRRYWLLAILGYCVNLLVVPFIALAGSWPLAACLMVLERFGKAIRKPSGDTMLSFAREQVGSGWTYGLQEAMDKVGAVTGPAIVAGVLYFRGDDYRLGFAVLGLPAVVAITIVLVTRFLYPDPSNLEVKKLTVDSRGFHRRYWLYLLAVGFVAMGFADWALVAYHFQAKKLFADAVVPLVYSLAMAVDAVSAIVFGRLYDRIGPKSLALAAAISSVFAPFVFLGGPGLAIAGAVLWGIGMGWQDSIMKSVVADLAPKEKRASSFGIFNTGYGIFWFAGSAFIGLIYGFSILGVVIFSVATQLAAVPLFLSIASRGQARA